MIRRGDKHHERGAEKCVSEHWVTPLLNLSPSKVSPQGWGGRTGGGGDQGGERKCFRGKRKGDGLQAGSGAGERVRGEESHTNLGKGKFGSDLLNV